MLKKLLLAATLFLLTAPLAATPRLAQPAPPRLIVVLALDQFRADYVGLYGHQWSRGLRRIFDTGAHFPLAEYPYALTVTCAGHATISTGAVPSSHGMVGNEWFDRTLNKQIRCTEDADVEAVPLGGAPGVERHAPTRLRVSTLADELRAQSARPATIVSVSQKPRTAVTLAGRPSPTTYAIWTEANGTWSTSSAYAASPWPAADRWAADHPVNAAYGQSWERLLPVDHYLFDDDAPGEGKPNTFPHQLVSPEGKPDNAFVQTWKRSPLSDTAVVQLAQHLTRELRLGQTPGGTDLLAIGLSALDEVGHRFGPRSHEVQDTLARADLAIGGLLDMLDTLVGRDHYVVALSSDHGVSPLPEHVDPQTGSAGRYSTTAMRATVDEALAPFLGEGPHLLTSVGANVYLQPDALAGIAQRPAARTAVTHALEAMPAIERVFWADELAARTATDDPLLRMARRSYMAGRSGDLMLVLSPFWMAQSTSSLTTHGTPWGYDTRVPIVFAGHGLTPGRHLVPASPVDIAPTLAALAGITLARTDGRVLTQALR